jgi:hypothetical protein
LSYRGRLASIVIISLALSGVLWACGPFFPSWILDDENGILEAPTLWLRDALQPLPAAKPAFAPVVADEKGPAQQTAAADRKDVEAALGGLPAAKRQAALDAYASTRQAILSYRESVESWKLDAAFAETPPPRPEPPASLAVPSGLPGELEDYLRGAVAWHQGKTDAARTAWEKLLARPAGERRLRSTWAAFMLGKAAIETDPAAAVRWFERTRELAAQGFPDPLGLAESSLGWQARAEMGRKRYDEALKLYLQQEKAGDPTALPSIRRACAKALDDAGALRQIARSNEARPIFTAWVLSTWTREDYEGPLSSTAARKWLAAIQAAGVTQADGADRLAWTAYRAGDFAAAESWLKRAPADAPMARWTRAKLLLREGKVAEAEPLLAQARAALPTGPTPDHDLWYAYESGVRPALQPRAAGELGATRLARGEYVPALDDLLRGGWWTDAAYVAERVLSSDELRAYVDKTWAPALAARYKPDMQSTVDDPQGVWQMQFAGMAPPPPERIAHDIRYLLGRRLVREGKLTEARPYLPEERRAALDDLARSLSAGRDPGRPAAERSKALFRAACLSRYQGLELLGTEVEPDWALFDAEFEVDSFAAARANPKTHRHLGPSADERQRVSRNRVEPEKRFHYRYRGIGLAREAADLLPAGDERARLLATAGNWVEGLDPKGARPLYDAIQSCCAKTEIAVRSRKVYAITNVPDACPADTRPKEEP